MINIIDKKYWYFLISLIIIVPGVISLFVWHLNLSIDFIGGSEMTLLFPKTVTAQTENAVQNVFTNDKITIETIQPAGPELTIKTKSISSQQNVQLLADLTKAVGSVKQEEFETIGPTIGTETTINALKALLVAALLIVLFIAWSFRSVPKPASSWRFGICAIVALVHDVLVVVGIFSILGHFLKVEVDSLFVTALLTVVGFSVHDTIVVFDRIRENLRRVVGVKFSKIVNDSLLQTLVRSLNTSLTAILVLFTILLFGGESIRWFIVALLIGIISGTYSSIFNASALLVVWQDWIDRKRIEKLK